MSLNRLLTDIQKNADYMTRGSFLESWDNDPQEQEYAANQFDGWSAGSRGKHLDPSIPEADLNALEKTSASTTVFAHRYLAHSASEQDRQSRRDVPTFSEINDAVDQIGTLFHKYAHLLTAVDYGLHPILRNDWFAIFQRPWLRPGVDPPVVPPPGVH